MRDFYAFFDLENFLELLEGSAASDGGSLVGYKSSYAVPLFERSDAKRVLVVLVLRNFSENFPKL